jgi:lipoprotein-anchoring transpeptidase ErfK/SrfK
VYADSFLVWIYKSPERDPAPIGYLRAGQSAALRSHEGHPKHRPVKKSCGKGWFAVEPAGFVCLDRTASLTPTRYSESMSTLAPAEADYLFHYALSMGTPSYRRLPTSAEATRRERIYGRPRIRALGAHERGHEQLAGAQAPTAAPTPSFLTEEGSVSRADEQRLIRRQVPLGSMLAFTQSFDHEGRLFLQSADGTLVPADRMRVFHRSNFAGEILGEKSKLPLAWAKRDLSLFSLDETCLAELPAQDAERGRLAEPAVLEPRCLSKLKRRVEQRAPLFLSGRAVRISGTEFAELREKNFWIPVSSLFLAEQRPPPKNVETGALTSPNPEAQKWIHFRIGRGTLVAYEGMEPVFATLASPGIGGVPGANVDPLSTRTTPVGQFRIHFKHVSDDMSPEQGEHRKFWIADVPYAQYFKQPFAIHVAYWHESFGEPMSGGCINVSPKDGKRLFDFTEPHLPKGWYGVGTSKEFGLGTWVLIER